MKLTNMSEVQNAFKKQKEDLIAQGKIQVKKEETYVDRAFDALDECIERTKRESIAYAKWRDAKNRELEAKAEYMDEEELKKEAINGYQQDYKDIYNILDDEDSILNKPDVSTLNWKDVSDMVLKTGGKGINKISQQ